MIEFGYDERLPTMFTPRLENSDATCSETRAAMMTGDILTESKIRY